MKKFLALLLAALLLITTLAFSTGCSKSDDNDEDQKAEEKADDKEKENDEDDEVTVVGKWEAELDMTDLMVETMVGVDEEMAEYFDIDDFVVVMVAEFNDDGTYTLEIDEDAFEDSFNGLIDAVKEGMPAYLMDMAGVETEEELEEALGMSIDEMIEESFSDDMVDEALEELGDDMNTEGEYEFNGKDELTFDDGEVDKIELTEDTLTFEETMGEEMPEELEYLFPIVFERVA